MQSIKPLALKPPYTPPPSLRHILYIDDDRDILMVTQLALEKIGNFHVETCSNGDKGLAKAKAMHPDLIMLDVMMPGMDGPSLLRAIKQSKQLCGTPVVFMTARIQPAEVDKYAALGAVGIIPKPFNPVTLSDDIRSIWHTHQKNSQGSAPFYFDDLRQQYLKGLPAKRAAIESFLQKTRTAKSSRAATQKFMQLAHNLAGSGETYGYSAISKSAKVLEEMLANKPHSPKLSLVTSRLIAAIDRALAARH